MGSQRMRVQANKQDAESLLLEALRSGLRFQRL
jgi:hypothetical protein